MFPITGVQFWVILGAFIVKFMIGFNKTNLETQSIYLTTSSMFKSYLG